MFTKKFLISILILLLSGCIEKIPISEPFVKLELVEISNNLVSNNDIVKVKFKVNGMYGARNAIFGIYSEDTVYETKINYLYNYTFDVNFEVKQNFPDSIDTVRFTYCAYIKPNNSDIKTEIYFGINVVNNKKQ